MELFMIKQFVVQGVPPSVCYCSLIAVYLCKWLYPCSMYKPYCIVPFNLAVKAELCLLLQQVLLFYSQTHFIGSILLGRVTYLPQIFAVWHSNTHRPLWTWVINIVQKVQLKAASMTIKKKEWISFGPVKFELFIKILENIGKYLWWL